MDNMDETLRSVMDSLFSSGKPKNWTLHKNDNGKVLSIRFPPDQEVEMDSQTASNNVTFSKFVKASTHRIDRDRARIGSFKRKRGNSSDQIEQNRSLESIFSNPGISPCLDLNPNASEFHSSAQSLLTQSDGHDSVSGDIQDEHSKLYDARETASVEESLRKPEDSVSSPKIDQTSTTDDKNSNPYYTFNDPTTVGSCVLESFRNSQEIYLVDLPQRVEYKITISEAQPVRKCNNSQFKGCGNAYCERWTSFPHLLCQREQDKPPDLVFFSKALSCGECIQRTKGTEPVET